MKNETKKMTATNISAATDIVQSSLNLTELIVKDETEKSKENISIKPISLEEIYDTVYKPSHPLVDGLFYNGCYIFAGTPKVGKSFFAAQLGYHICTGTPLWGMNVRQGEVLYLALEDTESRIQQRLSKMYGANPPRGYYFLTPQQVDCESAVSAIAPFLEEHTNTRLVIIDTLQKVRTDGGGYKNDYKIISKIKSISDKYDVCILIIHHTKKGKAKAKEGFDCISGSKGILGAADGAFLLRKDEESDDIAILEGTGRDQAECKLWLNRNSTDCIWQLTLKNEEEKNETEDEVLKVVAEFVKAHRTWKGTASDLINEIGLDIVANAFTRKLNVSVSQLSKDYGIIYENKRCHDGRILTLALEAA